MTIQITRWSLDTCGCVLDYEWDDAVPVEMRTHTPSATHKKCARHSPLNENVAAHGSRLMEENPRKNKALESVRKKAPPGMLKKDAEGNDVLIDSAVEWSYDANHVLHIKINGMPDAAKNALRSAFDAEHGNGNVQVE